MTDNLGGKIKKAQVGRVLESLTHKKFLVSKEYGKSKNFWPNQNLYDSLTDEQMKNLENNIDERRKELEQLKGKTRQL